MENPKENAVQRAVWHIGTQRSVARLCGVTPQAVQNWFRSGRLPAQHVLALEKAAEGKVSRHELRPDVFGTDPDLGDF